MRHFPLTLQVLVLYVFSVCASAQVVTTLYGFDSVTGSNPTTMAMVQGRDGNLYGTTTSGGAFVQGVIFRLSTAGTYTLLHSFSGGEGSNPFNGLVLGTNGNFYGATAAGGSAQQGVVFKMTPQGTVTVVHNFTGKQGTSPTGPVVLADDGNVYGTTELGGAGGFGTIYKLSTAGVLTKMHEFRSTDGAYPFALMQASDGNFYGITNFGGVAGLGTAYRITKRGVFTTLFEFKENSSGFQPTGKLIEGTDGNLYGTTSRGGDAICGCGTIFRLTTSGGLTTLHMFTGLIHLNPNYMDGPTQANNGELYGAAVSLGRNDTNQLYRMSSDGATYSTLYEFDTYEKGYAPYGRLVQHTNGILYGSTELGVNGVGEGFGQLYSLDDGLSAFVTFVKSSGKAGQSAQILGQGFKGTTSVTFNGVPTNSFSVLSDTYLTAVIPSGSATGPVVVTTPSGTLTSDRSFRIVQ